MRIVLLYPLAPHKTTGLLMRHAPLVAMFTLFATTALAGSLCPLQDEVDSIVGRNLAAFVVSKAAMDAPGECSNIVAGDFNGDGFLDYAAVLTEKIAPRTYRDGGPFFSSYVVVFLRNKLPYAEYQAVMLLGHNAAGRLMLMTQWSESKGKPENLVIVLPRYSRTVYEWTSTGFAVKEHAAD